MVVYGGIDPNLLTPCHRPPPPCLSQQPLCPYSLWTSAAPNYFYPLPQMYLLLQAEAPEAVCQDSESSLPPRFRGADPKVEWEDLKRMLADKVRNGLHCQA